MTSNYPQSSPKAKANHGRLCKLLMETGRRVLQDVFDSIHPPSSLDKFLNSSAIHNQLIKLKGKKVLHNQQWNTLFPRSGDIVSSNNFDITLLFLLLRNICNIKTPVTGWSAAPSPEDQSLEADLVRIKRCRNELYAHKTVMALHDVEFENEWSEIETALIRLGGNKYQSEIQNLKFASLDPEMESYYHDLLQSWEEREDMMRKLDVKVTSGNVQVLQEIQKLHQKLDFCPEKPRSSTVNEEYHINNMHNDYGDSYSQRLKIATAEQTETHQGGINASIVEEAKLDQIFSTLSIHQGRKGYPKSGIPQSNQHKCDQKYEKIGTYNEIFSSGPTLNQLKPKRILIDGKAGIGKTLFSQKIIRDWAKDGMFHQREEPSSPHIKFAFLITFRQLNLLGDQKLTLKELLNHSSILNEETILNDTVMEYIFQHPTELMLVLDGYDEYENSTKIINDFGSQFPNDPKNGMPVAALLSKLIRGRMFRQSLIMVTSRTGEAIELAEKIVFDRYVHIIGFSTNHVHEYVEKYFHRKSEDMKSKAINHIKSNQYYLSFGCVPLLCYLMCIYIEWDINNSGINSLPKTLTEFYSKVIYCIESVYNRAICKEDMDKKTKMKVVQKNLERFQLLAEQMVKENRFCFSDQDLQKLNLTEKEMVFLKSSSLLCCNQGVRTSPFTEASYEYSFNHFSFQEFFAAQRFLSIREIPTQFTELMSQFMSGLMDPEKDKDLMINLLGCVNQQLHGYTRQTLASLRCLMEYNNEDFVARVLTNNHSNRYWSAGSGETTVHVFNRLTDVDCRVIAFFVDRLTAVSHSLLPHALSIGLYFRWCTLTPFGLSVLLPSLTVHNYRDITTLVLLDCKVNDECAQCIGKYLSNTSISKLHIPRNCISDVGLESIVDNSSKLTHLNVCYNEISHVGASLVLARCCNLQALNLYGNQISDEGRERIRRFCQDECPKLKLDI